MLRLVNRDRQAAGLAPVEWDDVAAAAGQAHTEEMVSAGYLSHWNQAGYGSDHRYAFAGGTDAVFENAHATRQSNSDGRGVRVSDWGWELARAEDGFMNSPGHRANILDASHTHLGVGMAQNLANGRFCLIQEFVNRYAQVDPTPPRGRAGETY